MIRARKAEPAKRTNAGPVSRDRLKSFVERIEKLEEERSAIGGDIKDVYTEAKGVGYDTKTLRYVVQERRLDAADRAERDTLREVYLSALGMAVEAVNSGEMSLREAAGRFGVSKSSLHRAVPKRGEENGTGENDSNISRLAVPEVSQAARAMVDGDLGEWLPPHDADGVIAETQEGLGPNAVPEEAKQPSQVAPPAITSVPEQRSQGAADSPSEPTEPAGRPVNADAAPPPVAGSLNGQGSGVGTIPREPDDDLTIPHFLRQVKRSGEAADPS